MRKPNVRQGMIGGFVIALFSAVSTASRSPDPLPTFAYVFAFALACGALAIALIVAITRPPEPPIRW
jgi:hypothetical protein